ncbi:nuclear transport factor 2 family protein [Pedobacter aquatilis]|uniref:nuclear transport factor 2 family protein n=1 Tax=Pedobacter aquatilis TaxID=351343 RepID=UPI00292D2E36|nr:nuclear transport factor 2 family protein [Pedobacter aquatilis]
MIKKIFVLASFLLISTFSFAQHEDVEKAVNKLTELLLNPDSVALDKITASSLSYGHSKGNVENKQQFIHTLLSGNSDFVEINITNQTIVVYNKTALVRHDLSAKTNDKNVPGSLKLYILQVWSKEESGWKLLGRQSVKLP